MNVRPLRHQKLSSRSLTSVYDVLSSSVYQNIYHLNSKTGEKITVYQATCPKSKMGSSKNETALLSRTPYITSENYHALNRNSSERSLIRSTSTLFYDLDTIAKRHSFHSVPELPVSNSELLRYISTNSNKNGFIAKSEAIVQECAAQVQPKLKMQDSLKITAKKLKKSSINDPMLSSEIFLRDNDYISRKSNSIVNQTEDRHQKFWSYAKYRTEFTNPIPEEKKRKKKDRGKRMENPCPCQLFSYACPCTDKKSLTELAKNSKSLTVADQITSTTKFFSGDALDPNQIYCRAKKNKPNSHLEDKPVSPKTTVITNKYDMIPVSEEAVSPTTKKETQRFTNSNSCAKNSVKSECRSHRKSKQIICPNCKEKLEILSTTEDEDSLKLKTSPICRETDNLFPSENTNCKNNIVDETDVCNHDPPCELIPVCQILPNDNIYVNSKCVRRISLTKHSPKMIRITKACRHHPPCIVVPSCQKLNVLKNNCEYIPPCLHRPRCVNVPLCVPISKNLNYEDLLNRQVDDTDNTECNHIPPCNYMSAVQQSSLNNSVNHQFHVSKNTCEYLSEYTPRFVFNSKVPCVTPTYSPCQIPIQLPCRCCRSNKSCQYDCVECKCNPTNKVQQSLSSDAVVYIRDVGCQFRSKNLHTKDSFVHSKTSSASFELTGTKGDSYYNNYHTLRYEDKCTNPVPGGELSLSTLTTSSLEIDDQCPSHGKHGNKKQTGFSPKSTASPFVAAFSTYADPILQYRLPISEEAMRETSKSNTTDTRTYLNKVLVKSRKSFLKVKPKKVFSIRRRRKSRRNNVSSRRIPVNQRFI